jgi:sterol desaturase/sphingolipid hydroxylase (fatty acid hydroxylase superfamily)
MMLFEHLTKAQVVIAVLAILLCAERLFPAVVIRNNFNRWIRNFTLAGLNFLIAPLIILPLTHFAAEHAAGLRPIWWNMAFDLLLLDLFIYVWHRLNHVLPFLWRFHEVHHLDETLDTTSALRFHFGEVALSALVRVAVIWLLSVPFATVIIFETLVVVAALFHHSNLKLPSSVETAIAKLVVTPSLHWVHHHAKREDTDSNYATVLSLWDIIFKSRSPNTRQLGMKIGVEDGRDENVLRLILRPFWKP